MTERQSDIAHQLLMLAMIIVDSFVVRSRVPDRHREAAAVRGIQSVGRTPADAILEMVRSPREAGRGQHHCRVEAPGTCPMPAGSCPCGNTALGSDKSGYVNWTGTRGPNRQL